MSWTPPQELEEDLEKITSLLFEQGMADPRDLRYREVKIFSFEEKAADSQRDHAWVLPDEQYAIGWNGLFYRVLAVGSDADVGADIENALAFDREAQAKADAEGTTRVRRNMFMPQIASASYGSSAPLKAVFLARLGKGELAQRYWKY